MKHLTKKNVGRALIVLAVLAVIISLIRLLLWEVDGAYEIGHVFFDYIDDTDYINPLSPYVNVGGRVYFVYKEPYLNGAVKNYCNIVAYVDYDTGVAHKVCTDKNCIHNKLNYTKRCKLVDFTSNLRLDDQGYIYGEYCDRDRDEYTLARYNLYNQTYQELYKYTAEDGIYNPPFSTGYTNVYPYTDPITYNNYVYFYEYIFTPPVGEYIGFTRAYLRRYNLDRNRTDTLLECDSLNYVPFTFDVFDGRIYMATKDGFYSYDFDVSEDSRETLFTYDTVGFDFVGIINVQYDRDTKDIYFIALDSSYNRTLCRVKSTNYTDSAVVDRRVKELALGQVQDYELAGKRLYYTLYERRYVGPIYEPDGVVDVWAHVGDYDDTDGHIYGVSYSKLTDEEITSEIIYDYTEGLIDDWTVIGDWLYADRFEINETNEIIATGEREKGYTRCGQARISLTDRSEIIITPEDWKLDLSKK